MRLWQSAGTPLDEAVLAFTVGEDPVLDRALLPYDCLASAAHARMLAGIKILCTSEYEALLAALRQAYACACRGEFEITLEQEDGHTALEAYLVTQAGEAGKKIHTGRSRNDQVMAALRLLVREQMLELADGLGQVVEALIEQGERHREVVVPGYTHTRQAMPSTLGHLLLGAAEGLISDLAAFNLPLAWANRSPLGSAAGYGVPLPLDREQVAELLGFAASDVNTLCSQNTRGRVEAAVLFALHQVSLTLARLATDLVWLSSEAFSFVSLPVEVTTGSSIMPQKRNPDLLELIRAVPSSMMGRYCEVMGLLHGLPSGYHRDLQRSKKPLLAGLNEAAGILTVIGHAIERLQVNHEACAAALDPGIFATDRAYEHVRRGQPFREAYRLVKEQDAEAMDAKAALAQRQHLGAPGSSQRDALAAQLEAARNQLIPYVEGARCARALL